MRKFLLVMLLVIVGCRGPKSLILGEDAAIRAVGSMSGINIIEHAEQFLNESVDIGANPVTGTVVLTQEAIEQIRAQFAAARLLFQDGMRRAKATVKYFGYRWGGKVPRPDSDDAKWNYGALCGIAEIAARWMEIFRSALLNGPKLIGKVLGDGITAAGKSLVPAPVRYALWGSIVAVIIACAIILILFMRGKFFKRAAIQGERIAKQLQDVDDDAFQRAIVLAPDLQKVHWKEQKKEAKRKTKLNKGGSS